LSFVGFFAILSKTLFPVEDAMFLKKRAVLFGAIFYGILVWYIACVFLFPHCRIAQLTSIFESVWANFVFLTISLLFVSFLLSELTSFVYGRLRSSRWLRPKLGEMLISEGYLTEEKLKEALSEQSLRIGEVLVSGRRITAEQVNEALAQQENDSRSLGEILMELGYITDEDIAWAVEQMDRRLGRILRDKGYLSDDEIRRVLLEQRFGQR
jgi:hypothetical protein